MVERQPYAGKEAVRGELDLRGWDFNKDGNAVLYGEWGFYWSNLLQPEQALLTEPISGEAKHWLRMPHYWNAYRMGDRMLSGSGYATFLLKVSIDPSSRVLAMEIPAILTAFKVWVNGEMLGEAGKVGMNAETSMPGYKPQLVYFPQSGNTELNIVLQVSNFDHRLGGVWSDLKLGDAQKLSTHHNNDMGFELLLVGGLFVMGFYQFGLFLIRTNERSSLYFGTLCLLLGLRALFVGEGSIYQLFPNLPWETGVRVMYLCYYLAIPVGVRFFHSLYPDEMGKRVVRITGWFGSLFGMGVILLPTRIFTWTLQTYHLITVSICIYIMFCLLKACMNKRDGVSFAVIGLSVYTCTIIVDIAYYNQWIYVGDVSTFGLLFLVLMTSFIISMKSFKAFAAVESLSLQLQELNMGLEQRIKERTTELENSNATLEKMNTDLGRLETSRRHLLSNISHDLRTPMTLIQGYVEALIDGVVADPEQQNKYLRLILNRINGLNRLIADLFQLSKLEARQLDFNMQEMSIEEFVAYYGDRYEVDVKNAGVRFNHNAYIPMPLASSISVVRIDIDRIDQVLTNIIYNAIKHTPQGGLIHLQFIVDGPTLVVRVRDNGSGIEPEDVPFIFDRFYKKSKSRNTSEGGSGLGLSIAKEIIDYHGGNIWAESQIGRGACISFMLPLRTPSPL
ncbi:sensor histidine kinase [Paenibacillus radicis (ex Xue et al. 2023)]|uniref:histidine kinase n=1 Tax=Paenibacillus radicis (ex Xue et al. 2023) TaxID=2972489 RepID=A0ABT1YS99_9BACL|nr:ATP-binding protein [Paenibacillus radicis (ex Xue et al. 2023)]MCR8636056.1 ATP-binding protein [Paenibacillus radicis (ex Xue et al. 2023)]